MSAGPRLLAALAACTLVGCALPWRADPRARLAVVVRQGFPEPLAAAGPDAAGATVLLDMRPSMAAASAAGVGRFVAVREAAARFVRALPPDVAVAVHALGAEVSEPCGGELRTRTSRAGEDRAPLLADLAALEPAGDASLAGALAALRERLAAADALDGARVAVYTDLAPGCGGDPCGALEGLVEGGARLDLVVVGDGAVPACVDALALAAGAPLPAPAPVDFAAIPADGRGRAFAGVSDGVAIDVPPGPAQVVVALDPPLRLDDVPLLAGTTSRLTVLDFPALDPPVREWFWELGAGGSPDGDAGAAR